LPINESRQIALLTALLRHLAGLGLNAGMSDAGPAIFVRGGLAGRSVYVTVDSAGRMFTWRSEGEESHAVDDPAGAAERVASYLRKRDPEPDGRP
jgi:hypothetical protein